MVIPVRGREISTPISPLSSLPLTFAGSSTASLTLPGGPVSSPMMKSEFGVSICCQEKRKVYYDVMLGGLCRKSFIVGLPGGIASVSCFHDQD